MTCFRTQDGKTVRSQCKNPKEYARFCKAIERGMQFDEAFEARKVALPKGHPITPAVALMRKVIDGYNERTYFVVSTYRKRHSCTIEEALTWAYTTRRVKIKKRYRQRFERNEKGVVNK